MGARVDMVGPEGGLGGMGGTIKSYSGFADEMAIAGNCGDGTDARVRPFDHDLSNRVRLESGMAAGRRRTATAQAGRQKLTTSSRMKKGRHGDDREAKEEPTNRRESKIRDVNPSPAVSWESKRSFHPDKRREHGSGKGK